MEQIRIFQLASNAQHNVTLSPRNMVSDPVFTSGGEAGRASHRTQVLQPRNLMHQRDRSKTKACE
jgi:hypothetical protein